MLSAIRSNWRILKQGKPGKRFQEMYRKRHASRAGSRALQRVLTLVLGTVLVIAGPIVGLVPGPGGILFSLLGWALLASEVLVVARGLDWCEPRVRKAWSHIARLWKRATTAIRIGVCVVGASIVVMLVLAIRSYMSS